MTCAEPRPTAASLTNGLGRAGLTPSHRSVMLRFGTPADQPSLERLAELDSAKPPAQPVLLAEVDGVLLGALGLSDGSVIADPFRHTADLIALLRARARQLDGDRPSNRRVGLAFVVSGASLGLALGRVCCRSTLGPIERLPSSAVAARRARRRLLGHAWHDLARDG